MGAETDLDLSEYEGELKQSEANAQYDAAEDKFKQLQEEAEGSPYYGPSMRAADAREAMHAAGEELASGYETSKGFLRSSSEKTIDFLRAMIPGQDPDAAHTERQEKNLGLGVLTSATVVNGALAAFARSAGGDTLETAFGLGAVLFTEGAFFGPLIFMTGKDYVQEVRQSYRNIRNRRMVNEVRSQENGTS